MRLSGAAIYVPHLDVHRRFDGASCAFVSLTGGESLRHCSALTIASGSGSLVTILGCAPRSSGRACAGAVDHGRVLPDGDLRCVRLNLPSLVGAGGLNIVRHDRFRFVSPSRRRPCAACGELFMRGASRAPP